MPVPYIFGTLPNGNTIPLSYLDQNFAYIENQLATQQYGPTGPTGSAGSMGPTGPTGAQGVQGTTGQDGTSVNIIGSVPTVGGSPQTTLNTAFPSAVNGDGVIEDIEPVNKFIKADVGSSKLQALLGQIRSKQ